MIPTGNQNGGGGAPYPPGPPPKQSRISQQQHRQDKLHHKIPNFIGSVSCRISTRNKPLKECSN